MPEYKKLVEIVPPIYFLTVDGFGECAVKNEHGDRCIFLFTSEASVSRFVELMELPEHKEYTAVPLDSVELILEFLREIKEHTQLFSIDPVANCEFAFAAIDDLIAFQSRNL